MNLISLTSTTNSLKAVLKEVHITSQPVFKAMYSDEKSGSDIIGGANRGEFSDLSQVTIVDSPASGFIRNVSPVFIHNIDTVAHYIDIIDADSSSNDIVVDTIYLSAGQRATLFSDGLVTARCVIAYASDSIGTGFTLIFNSALNYQASISTTKANTDLTAADFVGVWKKYAVGNTFSWQAIQLNFPYKMTSSGIVTAQAQVGTGTVTSINKNGAVQSLPFMFSPGDYIMVVGPLVASPPIVILTGTFSDTVINPLPVTVVNTSGIQLAWQIVDMVNYRVYLIWTDYRLYLEALASSPHALIVVEDKATGICKNYWIALLGLSMMYGMTYDATAGLTLVRTNDKVYPISDTTGLISASITMAAPTYPSQNLLPVFFDFAKAWLTGTAYAIGDIRTNGGLYYRCMIIHTSGTFATDLSNGDWVLTGTQRCFGTSDGTTFYVYAFPNYNILQSVSITTNSNMMNACWNSGDFVYCACFVSGTTGVFKKYQLSNNSLVATLSISGSAATQCLTPLPISSKIWFTSGTRVGWINTATDAITTYDLGITITRGNGYTAATYAAGITEWNYLDTVGSKIYAGQCSGYNLVIFDILTCTYSITDMRSIIGVGYAIGACMWLNGHLMLQCYAGTEFKLVQI